MGAIRKHEIGHGFLKSEDISTYDTEYPPLTTTHISSSACMCIYHTHLYNIQTHTHMHVHKLKVKSIWYFNVIQFKLNISNLWKFSSFKIKTYIISYTSLKYDLVYHGTP